jgi:hypothetical protein
MQFCDFQHHKSPPKNYKKVIKTNSNADTGKTASGMQHNAVGFDEHNHAM